MTIINVFARPKNAMPKKEKPPAFPNLWDDDANDYKLPPQSEPDYLVVKGSDLAGVGITGFKPDDKFVVDPVHVTPEAWEKLKQFNL